MICSIGCILICGLAFTIAFAAVYGNVAKNKETSCLVLNATVIHATNVYFANWFVEFEDKDEDKQNKCVFSSKEDFLCNMREYIRSQTFAKQELAQNKIEEYRKGESYDCWYVEDDGDYTVTWIEPDYTASIVLLVLMVLFCSPFVSIVVSIILWCIFIVIAGSIVWIGKKCTSCATSIQTAPTTPIATAPSSAFSSNYSATPSSSSSSSDSSATYFSSRSSSDSSAAPTPVALATAPTIPSSSATSTDSESELLGDDAIIAGQFTDDDN